MKIFSDTESEVLQRFEEGAVVSNEKDEIILNRYAGIGFVQFGFDWDKMEETAKLTTSGINHLYNNIGNNNNA